MIISKIKHFFKSFPSKVIVIIALIVVVSAILLSIYVLNKDTSISNSNVSGQIDESKDDSPKKKVDIEQLRSMLSPGIDSVLRNFGIKNEWITNQNDEKNKKKGSKPLVKYAELFVKNVLIPNDLTSIEVNSDITSYIKSLGLSISANEDIFTKDIVITINNYDTSSAKLPIAKVYITHSDKVYRESSIICVIINNITEYDTDDVDKLLLNKSEFSFVFPRNLDEIDLQNKLLHSKKDVMINMTIGGKDNYETDFNSFMDGKAIRERVKNFTVDFPTVNTVLLTKKGGDIPQEVISEISNNFASYRIKIINDYDLTQLLTKAEEDSKEKLNIFTTNLRNKGNLTKSIITSVSVRKDDFARFYDDILTLKKLGYKFYNFTDFTSKIVEIEKKEQLKLDKAKDDKQKMEKLKQDEQKKKIDKKQTNQKKTETKKKTDVKKK